MSDWRKEIRTCALKTCREEFRPKREAQRFCSAKCRDCVAKKRKRSVSRSMDKEAELTVGPRSMDIGPTPHPDASEGHLVNKQRTDWARVRR